jgi:L-ascorbate metabolism protein UlaG (beta-lactamase superfamily)
VGELHAVIHEDLPRFHNSGYVITCGDESVYHPGDALTGPGQSVDVLCVPVCAPWMRVSEGVDFAREVAAARNLAIHDRVFSEAGLSIVDGHFGALLDRAQTFARIPDGDDL